MRTLLLELRPTALMEAEMPDLLRQLGESIIGRARVPVTVKIEGICPLPADAKVAIYRITQEALNNIAKHAGASQVWVTLMCKPGALDLEIRDDGHGFDPADVSTDHLGLDIMRERAEAVGAALTVDTRPGAGTRIIVAWRGEVPEGTPESA
jgi:signal transduction histidine kinase